VKRSFANLAIAINTGVIVVGLLIFPGKLANASETPTVVASIPPVHSLVSMVMEGVAEPTLLLPGSVSPHAYHLKPSDAAILESASVVFWISPTMETALAKPMEVIARRAVDVRLLDARGVKILPRREGGVLDHDEEHDEEHDHGHNHGDVDFDAHVWLNPVNAIVMLFVISETLGDLDSENAALYRANAIKGIDALKKLDDHIEKTLAPVRALPYVAFHDAYQYFEERYGLRPIATMAVDPDHAPSAKRLSAVRSVIKQAGAQCVFSEPQFDPKLIAVMIEGTHARASTLDPLGIAIKPGAALYSELLSTLAENLVSCLSAKP